MGRVNLVNVYLMKNQTRILNGLGSYSSTDAGEVEADLINRGNQKLAEYEEVYLEGQALSKMLSPQNVDGQCYFPSPLKWRFCY